MLQQAFHKVFFKRVRSPYSDRSNKKIRYSHEWQVAKTVNWNQFTIIMFWGKNDFKIFWHELEQMIAPHGDYTEFIDHEEWVYSYPNVLLLCPLQTSHDQCLTLRPHIEQISKHPDIVYVKWNSYRGTTISSYIGRLFHHIVTKRIAEFMKTSCRCNVNLLLFKTDHSTKDCVLIMNNMFDPYIIHQNMQVQVVFADFQNASIK